MVKKLSSTPLPVHRFQKLIVVAGVHHVFFHELHGLVGLHVGQVVAQDEPCAAGYLCRAAGRWLGGA